MTTKDCRSCKNFLHGSNQTGQRALYGSALRIDTCQARGWILGGGPISEAGAEKIRESQAAHCDNYSTSRSISLPLPVLRVGVGMPQPPAQVDDTITSCVVCHYFIEQRTVRRELDLPIGICAKRGLGIPEQKYTSVAQQCNDRARAELATTDPGRAAHQDNLMGSVQILPYLGGVIRVSGKFSNGSNEVETKDWEFIEPTEYPTDLNVSAAHEKMGIRAWRAVTHGGKTIHIPVFRIDSFTEEEQRLIPRTGDDGHPELYNDHDEKIFRAVLCWMKTDETPILIGPPGAGKTDFFRYMAWMMCVPFYRVSITNSTELDELAGATALVGDRTVFEEGVIPRAWQRRGVMVLDEPNVGPPEVWHFIRPLTDSNKQLVLPLKQGGTMIQRNPFCYFGLAINPSWDFRNRGAQPLAAADMSRLSPIYADYPPREIELQILKARLKEDGAELSTEMLTAILNFGAAIREMGDNLSFSLGIREQIKAARNMVWLTPYEAYRLTILDALDPDESKTVLAQLLTAFPDGGIPDAAV